MSEQVKKEPVVINYVTLKTQVQNGMKRKELSDFYGIPESQMKAVLQKAGLKIRKLHTPTFQLVGFPDALNDINEAPEVNTEVNIEVNAESTPEIPEEVEEVVENEIKHSVWE